MQNTYNLHERGVSAPHIAPTLVQTVVLLGAMTGLAFLSAKGLEKWTDAPFGVCFGLALALTALVSGLLLNEAVLRARGGGGQFLQTALQFGVAAFAGFLVLVFFDAYGIVELNLEKVGTEMPRLASEAANAKRQLADASSEADLHAAEYSLNWEEYKVLDGDGIKSNDALATNVRKRAEEAKAAEVKARVEIRAAQTAYNKAVSERDGLLAQHSLITRTLACTASGEMPWVWGLLALFCFAAEWAVGVWAVAVCQMWRQRLNPVVYEREVMVPVKQPMSRAEAMDVLDIGDRALVFSRRRNKSK